MIKMKINNNQMMIPKIKIYLIQTAKLKKSLHINFYSHKIMKSII